MSHESKPDDQKDVVVSHFTSQREQWREDYATQNFRARGYRLRAEAALRWLDALPRQRILDVGTGAGIQANAAYDRGWEVVGIDMTPAMVSDAASSFSGPNWIVGSAEALPFSDSTFDVVMMLGVIGYVPDASLALNEARRCLSPGGALIVSWHTRVRLLERMSRATTYLPRKIAQWFRNRQDTPRSWGFYVERNRAWSKMEFARLLKDAGFEPSQYFVADFGKLRPFGLKLWPESVDIGLSAALELIANRSGADFLQRGAFTHVVLARPTEVAEGRPRAQQTA